MNKFTVDDLQEALRPIASLISKSEKAPQKLMPGTWQHSMLRNNLRALHIASALLKIEIDDTDFTPDDLQEARFDNVQDRKSLSKILAGNFPAHVVVKQATRVAFCFIADS